MGGFTMFSEIVKDKNVRKSKFHVFSSELNLMLFFALSPEPIVLCEIEIRYRSLV